MVVTAVSTALPEIIHLGITSVIKMAVSSVSLDTQTPIQAVHSAERHLDAVSTEAIQQLYSQNTLMIDKCQNIVYHFTCVRG